MACHILTRESQKRTKLGTLSTELNIPISNETSAMNEQTILQYIFEIDIFSLFITLLDFYVSLGANKNNPQP